MQILTLLFAIEGICLSDKFTSQVILTSKKTNRSLRKRPFLHALRRWGRFAATQRQKFHTDDVRYVQPCLVDEVVTQMLIIVLRMTDKRQKATKVKCKRGESLTKQSIFVEYSLLQNKHLSFAGARSQITQHFTNAKRPQQRRASGNGCFRSLNNSWIKKSKIALMGQTMSCPRRINRLRHRRLETSVRCGGGRQENKILKEILYHSPHNL